jgi:small-conductance mechanosensitive channel
MTPLLSSVWLETVAPAWMSSLCFLDVSLAQWLALLVLAAGAVAAGILLEWLLLGVGGLLARHAGMAWDEKVRPSIPGPTRLVLALLLFHLFLPLLGLPAEAHAAIALVVRTLLLVGVTWFLLRLLTVGSRFLEAYLSRRIQDPERLRSLQTQIAIPAAMLRFVIVLLGLSLVLLQFEVVRSIGVSLLASAGLAGIVVGLAAQRLIGNLLAGVQLALFQPIRIGDAVFVENEAGSVEEIGLTYVVVKLPDQRRLILPVSYFLEKPFQNWTRGEADLIGTINLSIDYTVPIDGLRAELKRILEATPLWDGRVQGIQVINLTASRVEVRALVSARDAGQFQELSCLVRERLLGWLQAQGRAQPPGQQGDRQQNPPG